MFVDEPNTAFSLSDVEVETLRRAAVARGLSFDPQRKNYSAAELSAYGIVREAYNSQELRDMGVDPAKVVTSFDAETEQARQNFSVDVPFAREIKKWQLPIDICEWRVFISEFPQNTVVEPHVHPANTSENPGGSLRTVLKGSLTYAGMVFGAGDWFFIPNGVPYSFRSDPNVRTIVMYKYAFFAAAKGNRFSSPMELEKHRSSADIAA